MAGVNILNHQYNDSVTNRNTKENTEYALFLPISVLRKLNL